MTIDFTEIGQKIVMSNASTNVVPSIAGQIGTLKAKYTEIRNG